MGEQVLIIAPDRESAQHLCTALAALEANLRETQSGGYEVLIALKSPNPDLVLTAIVNTVEHWLENQQLASATIQVGNQPYTTIAPRPTLV